MGGAVGTVGGAGFTGAAVLPAGAGTGEGFCVGRGAVTCGWAEMTAMAWGEMAAGWLVTPGGGGLGRADIGGWPGRMALGMGAAGAGSGTD